MSVVVLPPLAIDVLAPEGVGARADLSTEAPGRTIEVPGGTQALQPRRRRHAAIPRTQDVMDASSH